MINNHKEFKSREAGGGLKHVGSHGAIRGGGEVPLAVPVFHPDPTSGPAPGAVAMAGPAIEKHSGKFALSLRTPAEIVAMPFDPSDLYLENGIFAKGQLLTLLGPGGVGKSRLLLQLAICTVLQQSFMGLSVTSKNLKWLIVQSENGCRRLQTDLSRMKGALSGEEWQAVSKHIAIHTLEHGADDRLKVGSYDNEVQLAELIRRAKADVVAFDPLIAFATGSLNSDSAMLATCERLQELARLGMADCAVIIVHHALNGLAGIKKAAGFQRSDFGRGSKILNLKTRGQINVVPADEKSNEKLVVTCGKNSNGPEFAPLGVELDPATMWYNEDPEFDFDQWKQSVSSAGRTQKGVPPTELAELVRELPMKKKQLVQIIMDETGCEKSTAYNAITAADGATIRLNINNEYEPIG